MRIYPYTVNVYKNLIQVMFERLKKSKFSYVRIFIFPTIYIYIYIYIIYIYIYIMSKRIGQINDGDLILWLWFLSVLA